MSTVIIILFMQIAVPLFIYFCKHMGTTDSKAKKPNRSGSQRNCRNTHKSLTSRIDELAMQEYALVMQSRDLERELWYLGEEQQRLLELQQNCSSEEMEQLNRQIRELERQVLEMEQQSRECEQQSRQVNEQLSALEQLEQQMHDMQMQQMQDMQMQQMQDMQMQQMHDIQMQQMQDMQMQSFAFDSGCMSACDYSSDMSGCGSMGDCGSFF